MGTIGSLGLHTQVQPHFGARGIVERSRFSPFWDRCGVYDDGPPQYYRPMAVVISLSLTASGVTTASLSISLPRNRRSKWTSNASNCG